MTCGVVNLFSSAYLASQILKHELAKSHLREARRYLHHTGELWFAEVGVDNTLHFVGVQVVTGVAGLGGTHHADGELSALALAGGECCGPGVECHGGWRNLLLCGGGAWVLGDPIAKRTYGLLVSIQMICGDAGDALHCGVL